MYRPSLDYQFNKIIIACLHSILSLHRYTHCLRGKLAFKACVFYLVNNRLRHINHFFYLFLFVFVFGYIVFKKSEFQYNLNGVFRREFIIVFHT